MNEESKIKLLILKKAKGILIEGMGMCYALSEAVGGGFTRHSSLVGRFPEFNRRELGATKGVGYQEHYGIVFSLNALSKDKGDSLFLRNSYWWPLDSKGHQQRLTAFDKLIEIYTEKCNKDS